MSRQSRLAAINCSITDTLLYAKYRRLRVFQLTMDVIKLIIVSVRMKRHVVFKVYNSTRNSSGDEIANVNFLYDDIGHVLQNTINSCINSGTDRRGYVLERMFTKFSEITQYNGHYAVQGHSRSPILVPIESSYTTSY